MKRRADGGRSADASVRSALGGLEDLRGCRVGLRVMGLEGPLAGVGFGMAEGEAFPSASLIKVLVLVELLRWADSGLVSLEHEVVIRSEDLVEDSEMLGARGLPAWVSLGELAEGMITVSDNAATNGLIRRLGMDQTNASARELGLRRTSLRREMMEDDGFRSAVARGGEHDLGLRHGDADAGGLGRIYPRERI